MPARAQPSAMGSRDAVAEASLPPLAGLTAEFAVRSGSYSAAAPVQAHVLRQSHRRRARRQRWAQSLIGVLVATVLLCAWPVDESGACSRSSSSSSCSGGNSSSSGSRRTHRDAACAGLGHDRLHRCGRPRGVSSGCAYVGVVDTDRNGTHFQGPLERWAHHAFSQMDRDGDGQLTVMEIYAAVLLVIAKVNDTPLSLDPPPLELVDRIFTKADTNKDGMLDFEEFDSVLVKVLMKNLCIRLVLKTGAKLILAPLIAILLLRAILKVAPERWLPHLSAMHRGVGLAFATIMLCGVILPQISPLIDHWSRYELMRSLED